MKLLFIYSPTELVIKKAKPGYKFENKNINPWKQNFMYSTCLSHSNALLSNMIANTYDLNL